MDKAEHSAPEKSRKVDKFQSNMSKVRMNLNNGPCQNKLNISNNNYKWF